MNKEILVAHLGELLCDVLLFCRVLAENEYGVGVPATLSKPIKVSEEPGSPRSIKCTDITKTSVTLQWSKPEYNGGSEILDFIIEYMIRGYLIYGS